MSTLLISSTASDTSFVSADTAPTLSSALTYADGSVVNLTGATVRFQMRLSTEYRYTVDAAATVANPATSGLVSYAWVAGDLATPGTYVARWQITFSGGTIQHTESLTLTISAS